MLTADQKRELEATIQQFVGKPIGPAVTSRDAVNESMILQWCDAMGDANPVYQDAAVAEKSVHGGLVAPPMMLDAWTMQGWEMHRGYDEPTNEEQRLHKILTDAGYSGVLGTNTEQEFDRYLRIGDEVTAETIIESISEEKATGAGIGYFITTKTTFTDAAGAQVGWMNFRVLKFIPKEAPQAVSDSAGGAAEAYVPARIKPPMGHDNAWWWNEVAAGRIAVQRCTGCQELRHPPRPMCPSCRSMEWDSIEISGRGTLHTFTVIHYPQFPGYDFPICAALVDLEEGVRMVSDVMDCKPEALKIGMKLQAYVHEDDDGFKLPLFRPAE
jgi:uncharacterized OB-fold protein/acyl dehydratase